MFVPELGGKPGLSEKDLTLAMMRDGKFDLLSTSDLDAVNLKAGGIQRGNTQNAPEGSMVDQVVKGTARPESDAQLDQDGFLVGLNLKQANAAQLTDQQRLNLSTLMGNAGVLDNVGRDNGLTGFLKANPNSPLSKTLMIQIREAWGITGSGQSSYRNDASFRNEALAIEALFKPK